MAAPFEIVAAPYTIYVAAVGTAFPDVSATPGGSWTKLGTSGTKNYRDDGVTVTHDQSIEEFIPAGGTAARKAFRTEESLIIEFELVDLTIEQYAKGLNDATVTTTAAGSGTAGIKSINLLQGLSVTRFAVVARGVSTIDDAYAAQYQIPIAYQAESPAPAHKKDEPAGLAFALRALEHDSLGFGKLVMQSAAPL
jgi:hypothetical protein